MDPLDKAALVVGIVAVLIWTPSLADRAWRRLNRWAERKVSALTTDAPTADDLRLHPDVRTMRREQMSSDWARWEAEVSQ